MRQRQQTQLQQTQLQQTQLQQLAIASSLHPVSQTPQSIIQKRSLTPQFMGRQSFTDFTGGPDESDICSNGVLFMLLLVIIICVIIIAKSQKGVLQSKVSLLSKMN
jgi:hypothetical protein